MSRVEDARAAHDMVADQLAKSIAARTQSDQTKSPRKVFVVSYGSYSDYQVDSVWESKDDAEWYAEQHGYEVEENYEYWPAGSRPEIVEIFHASWNPTHGTWYPGTEKRDIAPGERAPSRPVIKDQVEWAKGRPYPHVAWVKGEGPDQRALDKAMKDAVAAIRVREGI